MLVELIGGEPVTHKFTAPANVVRGKLILIGNLPVIPKDTVASGQPVACDIGGGIYRTTEIHATPPVAGSACNTAGVNVTGAASGKHLGNCLSVTASQAVFHHNPRGEDAA